MAGARVANTFELLEKILMNLVPAAGDYTYPFARLDLTYGTSGARTLLTAQRVSKTFRDTIKNSSSIQRALFLKFPASSHFGVRTSARNTILNGNRHLLLTASLLTRYPLIGRDRVCIDVSIQKNSICEPKDDGFLAAEASWRGMFLTDKKYMVPSILVKDETGFWKRKEVEFCLNATLGQLVDLASV